MNTCIFCKIVNKDIPNHTVYEDDNTLAFLDIKPHTKGHTIVIPKKHGILANDFTELEYLELMRAARIVMKKLKLKLSPDGFNIGWNDGTAAGQVVPHLHLHIMPRWNGDGGGSQHSIINNPGDMSVEEVIKFF
ncbi:MAG TPA: HIT family protein [Candidatus Nanoarchaeia archaeon]|nr:HIT family protein [Candidatus Nanoarchaeia archaeon]